MDRVIFEGLPFVFMGLCLFLLSIKVSKKKRFVITWKVYSNIVGGAVFYFIIGTLLRVIMIGLRLKDCLGLLIFILILSVPYVIIFFKSRFHLAIFNINIEELIDFIGETIYSEHIEYEITVSGEKLRKYIFYMPRLSGEVIIEHSNNYCIIKYVCKNKWKRQEFNNLCGKISCSIPKTDISKA